MLLKPVDVGINIMSTNNDDDRTNNACRDEMAQKDLRDTADIIMIPTFNFLLDGWRPEFLLILLRCVFVIED